MIFLKNPFYKGVKIGQKLYETIQLFLRIFKKFTFQNTIFRSFPEIMGFMGSLNHFLIVNIL